MYDCSFKVAVIGCGHVGVTAAYAMLLNGSPTELVLYARDRKKAEGEALDLEHGQAFLGSTNVIPTDNFDDVAGSQFIVVTAGVAQKPGQTRLDLVKENLEILEKTIPPLVAVAPDATILIVANPVDILTHHAVKIGGRKPGQIFGSGTLLDTARFRFHLGEVLGVHPRSVHAYILGEHGDSSFPTIAGATIGGQPLLSFPGCSKETVIEAYNQNKNAAYKIIEAKGATYYAIGVVIMKVMEAVFQDSRSVLPVSIPLNNYHGISDVCLSVPCIVGRQGVSHILDIQLSEEELHSLQKSAETVKQFIPGTL